jgi:hypothetical protein
MLGQVEVVRGRVMLAWVMRSALTCGICGALGSGAILPIAPMTQSYLFLAMAIAATVMLGAFDAYETQDPYDMPEEA